MLTERIAKLLKREFGDGNVEIGEPVMGGEDFGRFNQLGVPICMLRLGAVSQKRLDEFAARHQPPNSLHSALFYPDIEESLAVGVPAMVYVATDLLKPAKRASSGK
jgi:hippurate hydrolase